jgi:pimeloyl-ACP methyl ester carboxylesterase
MIDVGSGPPIVVVPGIQGRWEWLEPAVDVLSTRWRVITSSLPGEPGSDANICATEGFDAFIPYVDRLLDAAGVPSAVICGVSFGGLIAVRYAARRPERVSALILVSALGPRWQPERQQLRYMRWPTLSSPIFAARALRRFWPELRTTYPDARQRLGFCAKVVSRLVRAPAAPSRMGMRARMAAAETFDRDCARVTAPTLVVAGERELDKVVGHDETLSYLTAIEGARFQLLEKTGHLGTISAPERFAAIVSRFLNG